MKSAVSSHDAVGLLARLQPKRILLLGDLLLDKYTYGTVSRVSPEAPVPILLVQSESQLPGGAGNVALNLAGLGNQVILCSRIGDDEAGRQLKELLEVRGATCGTAICQTFQELSSSKVRCGGSVDVSNLVIQRFLTTPTKNRLIAHSQQLLRVDCEKPQPMDSETHAQLLERALSVLDHVDIVAISDYGKGSIDRSLLHPLFEKARQLGIPVVVDPKSKDLRLYQGATLIKPNLKEATEASSSGSGDLDQIASNLLLQMPELPYLMITRSQDGISLFERSGQRSDYPARVQEVLDVTGAGDCVLAALVHAMACSLPMEGCCHLANIAGALAVQKVGCVQLTLKDVARRMLQTDAHNKIFDETHLFALIEACRGEQVHLIQAAQDELQLMAFLLSLQKHRHRHPDAFVILQLPPHELGEQWIELLAQQNSIDLLMFMQLDHSASQIDALQVLKWQGGELITEG